MTKTKHQWVGFQYDSTICNHCRIDTYDKAITYARGKGGGEYCEDVPAEKEAWKEYERTLPARKEVALNKVRAVLTNEEYQLLGLRYYGEYRPRDYIKV